MHQQPTQTGSRSFKWFSARLAPALVPLLELVRARIRNTRGIENGISLNRDTNTIEALAALHIPAPHMMHTESRNKPTEETEPHPSRYDRKGPAGIGTRITRALPACNCTKGPQYRNTDYCERYPHRHDTSHGEQERTQTTRVRRAKEVVNLVRINSELKRQRLRFAYRAGPLITNILGMKWNSRRAASIFFWACFLGALIMSLIVTSEI